MHWHLAVWTNLSSYGEERVYSSGLQVHSPWYLSLPLMWSMMLDPGEQDRSVRTV